MLISQTKTGNFIRVMYIEVNYYIWRSSPIYKTNACGSFFGQNNSNSERYEKAQQICSNINFIPLSYILNHIIKNTSAIYYVDYRNTHFFFIYVNKIK